MVRTVAGGSLPASAVVAASGYQADRGVMVLITTRARLGPRPLTVHRSACPRKVASRVFRRVKIECSSVDFKVERPLGLELE